MAFFVFTTSDSERAVVMQQTVHGLQEINSLPQTHVTGSSTASTQQTASPTVTTDPGPGVSVDTPVITSNTQNQRNLQNSHVPEENSTAPDNRALHELNFDEVLSKASETRDTATVSYEYTSYIEPVDTAIQIYRSESKSFLGNIDRVGGQKNWVCVNVIKDYTFLPAYLQSISEFSNQQSSWKSKAKYCVDGIITERNVRNFIFTCGYKCSPEESACQCSGKDLYRVYETGYIFHYTKVHHVDKSIHECQNHEQRIPSKRGIPEWMKKIIDRYALLGYSIKVTLAKAETRIGIKYFPESRIKSRITEARRNVKNFPKKVRELIQRFDVNTFDPTFKPEPGIDDNVLLGDFVSSGNEGVIWVFTTPAMLKRMNLAKSIHIDTTFDADEEDTEVMYLQGVDFRGKVFPIAISLCDSESQECYEAFLRDCLLERIFQRLPKKDRPVEIERDDGSVYYKFANLKYVVCDGIGYMTKLVLWSGCYKDYVLFSCQASNKEMAY
jgi:hypothetical protein